MASIFSTSKAVAYNILRPVNCFRGYAKQSGEDCRRAIVDIPPEKPVCPCDKFKEKKSGILHKIKLNILEGGSNFGTPYKLIRCDKKSALQPVKPLPVAPSTTGDPSSKRVPRAIVPIPKDRPGVQVSILGADSPIGQYAALLLKQCPAIKKICLYETTPTVDSECGRNIYSVTEDLKHIDTNCQVEAYSCALYDLERSLARADIVLMLDTTYVNVDMSYEKQFLNQAPMIKQYADAISRECPRAFVIIASAPIDCMVPLVAETMKETGWYNPNKVLGSLAVPEMRARTLTAKTLGLDPRYVRVPCVGGTEGEALLPLFSKAVDYFDFKKSEISMLTKAVRNAPRSVTRCDGSCSKAGELSEAHALAGLVSKVALALLCQDIVTATGFVEADCRSVISPAKFIANPVQISKNGICKNLGLPHLRTEEMQEVDTTLINLCLKLNMMLNWYDKYTRTNAKQQSKRNMFFSPKEYARLNDCAYAT